MSVRVGGPALELLGRHVLEGSEDRSLLGEVRLGRRRREHRVLGAARQPLGEAEVEQLHAGLRQHDVSGLQVPVHDALPVRLVERVGDLRAVAQGLLERQRTLGEALRERVAFEKLHDEVVHVSVPSDVVDRADVGMRELRDRLGLAVETLPHLGGGRHVRRQDLDRDDAQEAAVARPVDLSHPSRAQRREDLVGAETRARRESHLFLQPRLPVLHNRERLALSRVDERVDEETGSVG
jgi:hypothetical protein